MTIMVVSSKNMGFVRWSVFLEQATEIVIFTLSNNPFCNFWALTVGRFGIIAIESPLCPNMSKGLYIVLMMGNALIVDKKAKTFIFRKKWYFSPFL